MEAMVRPSAALAPNSRDWQVLLAASSEAFWTIRFLSLEVESIVCQVQCPLHQRHAFDPSF